MNRRIFAPIFLGALLLFGLGAHADRPWSASEDEDKVKREEVQQDLRHSLGKQLFELRTPYAATVLRFNAQGNLAGRSAVGPWTIDGIFQLSNLWLEGTSLEIEGQRAIVVLSSGKTRAPARILTDNPIHLTIDTGPGLPSENQLRESLARIFSPAAVQQHFSDYWKPLVDLDKDCSTILREKPDGIVATLSTDHRPVYYCLTSKAITPPKPLETRGPAYSAQARKAKVRGTVRMLVLVNEEGLPEIMRITRRLEPSLDVRALVAVSEWKFEPATKNGKPVAFLLIVKVAFRLED